MGKLDDMLKPPSSQGNITEMKSNNALSEAEANEQASVQAATEANANDTMSEEAKAKQDLLDKSRAANLKEGEERREAKAEADKKKFDEEHFNAEELKLRDAQLKEAHASTDDTLSEDVLEISHGRHRVKVVPQKGLSYNYYAECSCAWQGRFMTQELAEVTAQKHVFGKQSSAA
jgi:hypothetical protein